MKRAKTKPAKKNVGKRTEANCASDERVNIADLRSRIARTVNNRALPMVKATISEVENGHYLAMKYLFEMVGLYPVNTVSESTGDDSLAKVLLRNMGIGDELSRDDKVTKDSSSGRDDGTEHIVE